MTIRYEFDSTPEPGESLPIADGVHWLRMPLPFELAHINLWLLEDNDSWVIVDSGMRTEDTQILWKKTIASLMDAKPLKHVVVTHLHPDHVGCAGWLVDEYDVDLWMTRDEYLLCRILVADRGRSAPEEGIRFYKGAGFPDDALGNYQKMFGMFGKYVAPLPEAYKRIKDGDQLMFAGHRWEIVVGRGHSPEHACLFDAERNLLISGDQILPTISSNVSVYPTEPEANPLRDWIQSLQMLKTRLPKDVLVLPSHGKPFRGVHARLDALINEHLRAVDVFPALFKGRITKRNIIMATGESISHLNYLVEENKIRKEPDANGVTWYRQA